MLKFHLFEHDEFEWIEQIGAMTQNQTPNQDQASISWIKERITRMIES